MRGRSYLLRGRHGRGRSYSLMGRCGGGRSYPLRGRHGRGRSYSLRGRHGRGRSYSLMKRGERGRSYPLMLSSYTITFALFSTCITNSFSSIYLLKNLSCHEYYTIVCESTSEPVKEERSKELNVYSSTPTF